MGVQNFNPNFARTTELQHAEITEIDPQLNANGSCQKTFCILYLYSFFKASLALTDKVSLTLKIKNCQKAKIRSFLIFRVRLTLSVRVRLNLGNEPEF